MSSFSAARSASSSTPRARSRSPRRTRTHPSTASASARSPGVESGASACAARSASAEGLHRASEHRARTGSGRVHRTGPAGLRHGEPFGEPGQDVEGRDRLAALQPKQASKVLSPRAHPAVGSGGRHSIQELECASHLPGRRGRLTGGTHAASTLVAVRRQLRRPIQRARRRGVATARRGDTRGPLQLGRGLLVRAERGGREVPGAWLPDQDGGECTVGRPPFPARGAPPDHAVDQRMGEAHAAVAHLDQAVDLRLVERRDVGRHRGRGTARTPTSHSPSAATSNRICRAGAPSAAVRRATMSRTPAPAGSGSSTARNRPAARSSASPAARRAPAGYPPRLPPEPQQPGRSGQGRSGREPRAPPRPTTARPGPSAGRRRSRRGALDRGRRARRPPDSTLGGPRSGCTRGRRRRATEGRRRRPGPAGRGLRSAAGRPLPRTPPTGRPATGARARAPPRAHRPEAPEALRARRAPERAGPTGWRTRDRPRSVHPKRAGR